MTFWCHKHEEACAIANGLEFTHPCAAWLRSRRDDVPVDSTAAPLLLDRNACPTVEKEEGSQRPATTVRSNSDPIRAKPIKMISGSESKRRNPSLQITIPLPAIFSRATAVRDGDTKEESEVASPGYDGSRRNSLASLRGSIGSKFTALTRRLSSATLSPTSPFSPLRRSSKVNPEQVASALANEYKDEDMDDLASAEAKATAKDLAEARPDANSCTCEIEYLRRKNLAEAQRGKCYEEDEFERDTAAAARERQIARTLMYDSPPGFNLVRWGSRKSDAQSSHTETATQDNEAEPLSLATVRSRFAIQRAKLSMTPPEWSGHDSEVLYYSNQKNAEMLMTALHELVDHEKCNWMTGLCEHLPKTPCIIDEDEEEVEYYPTLEEALKHTKVPWEGRRGY